MTKFEEKKAKGKGKSKGKGKEKDKSAAVPEPIILKKSTFATFNCDLKSVNWSDQYIDFIWAAFPKFKDKAIRIDEGSLKPEVYLEKGKDKGKAKGKAKGKESGKSSRSNKTTNKGPSKIPLPTTLTVHVGFGLKRHGQIQEIVVAKKSKKSKKK